MFAAIMHRKRTFTCESEIYITQNNGAAMGFKSHLKRYFYGRTRKCLCFHFTPTHNKLETIWRQHLYVCYK